MDKKDVVNTVITGVVGIIAGGILQYVDLPKALIDLWQRLFVNIWFVWLGAAFIGLYWLGKFLLNLHRATMQIIPAKIEATTDLAKRVGALTEQVSKTRYAAESQLSQRINAVDAEVKQLSQRLEALRAEQSQEVRKKEIYPPGDARNLLGTKPPE